MPGNSETLLCQYLYDPLDRLVNCTLSAQASTQRFYLQDRLTTEIQGAVQWSIVQHDDQLLAQQQRQNGVSETRLLTSDLQRSVLSLLGTTGPRPLFYTPYGHRPQQNDLLSLLDFNGERPDPVTGHYLLGNGYRAFNPVLMRFNSPDSWSPFGEGGINAYAYCVGDPVNRVDPTGHFGNLWKGLKNFFGFRTPKMSRSNLARTQVARMGSSPPGHPSSGYASVKSYTSVDPTFAPPVPNHSPPGSSSNASRFTVNNPERIASGRPNTDIQNWIKSTSGKPTRRLKKFTKIPHAGAEFPSIENLAIQYAGERVSRNMRANANLYSQGIVPNSLEVLREKFYEKKIKKIRSQ